MSSSCECAGIEIMSKYFISKGLFLITVAFGWHARASSHCSSMRAGAQAKRFSGPFSREHTFLPNVPLIPCQGRWANCHFWLPATKRQRLSTSPRPVSQNGPHTLKVPDYWFFLPGDFVIWNIFSVPPPVPRGDGGTFGVGGGCEPSKAMGGSLKRPYSSAWGLYASGLSVLSPLSGFFRVFFFTLFS